MYSILHLDWISITIPLGTSIDTDRFEDIQLWNHLDGKTMTMDPSKWFVAAPMFSYTHAYKSQLGTIALFGKLAMGLHIIYSGQVLQKLQSMGVGPDDIIKNAVYLEARCTRMDIALDLIDGGSTVDTFHKQLRSGKARTAAKKWRKMEDDTGGYTIYLGSRSSERMARIYDKKAERAAKLEEVSAANWIRVEIELKGEQAKNALKACKSNELDEVLKGFLVGAVDFPKLPEYQSALSMLGDGVLPTVTKRKDTQTRHWLLSKVAPVIAKEAAQDPEFYATLLTEVNSLIERKLKGKGDATD